MDAAHSQSQSAPRTACTDPPPAGPAGGGLSFAAWWLELAGWQRRRGERDEARHALDCAARFRLHFARRGGALP